MFKGLKYLENQKKLNNFDEFLIITSSSNRTASNLQITRSKILTLQYTVNMP